MKRFNLIDWIALILLIVGGLNWGLVGIFDFNLVSYFFGEMSTVSRLVYDLVGLSAIYLLAVSLGFFGNKTAVS
jgi:hypothetical protein